MLIPGSWERHEDGVEADASLLGVGGAKRAVNLATVIQLSTQDRRPTPFRGRYSIFAEPDALEISVLGRDILNPFAVVVDHEGRAVALIRDRHRYVIQES